MASVGGGGGGSGITGTIGDPKVHTGNTIHTEVSGNSGTVGGGGGGGAD